MTTYVNNIMLLERLAFVLYLNGSRAHLVPCLKLFPFFSPPPYLGILSLVFDKLNKTLFYN